MIILSVLHKDNSRGYLDNENRRKTFQDKETSYQALLIKVTIIRKR